MLFPRPRMSAAAATAVLCRKFLSRFKSLLVPCSLPFHERKLSCPSYCFSFHLPSPSSSTLPSPSLLDGSINFSRSICGTQWLHWATLLLKHKLISCSNPQSINHRPSTCSSLHFCLLLFSPSHLTSSPLFPFMSSTAFCWHAPARAYMCTRTSAHLWVWPEVCDGWMCRDTVRFRGRESWDRGKENSEGRRHLQSGAGQFQ